MVVSQDFHANIDPGESVTVILQARREGSAPEHWCQIVRDSDAQVIADAFTISCASEVRAGQRGRQRPEAAFVGV